MRLWSLHPCYLDSRGLVALWREALLAKKVLAGQTSGYRNHPQLLRFKEDGNPAGCINLYLSYVYEESQRRNFNFTKDKVDWSVAPFQLTVTSGQMKYETAHLLAKLKIRDAAAYRLFVRAKKIIPHPLFRIVKGPAENWEKNRVITSSFPS